MATNDENLSNALREFLSLNPDLQINVDNINIISQTFVKTKTFLKLPALAKGNIMAEMNAVKKLLWLIIIEQEKRKQVSQILKLTKPRNIRDN